MKRKALQRDARETQVINWFAIRIQNENEEPASMAEIARGLGLEPSSHLRSILTGLVVSGALGVERLERPGRWEGIGYMLKEGEFQRPAQQTRQIIFKVRGIEQMELL